MRAAAPAAKPVPSPYELQSARLAGTQLRSRAGQGPKPITVHYPQEVRDQLKILAVEQGTTLQALVGESFNMLFAKYGKPEIAPTEQKA